MAEKTETKKLAGPRPAHVLLESISRALAAGVDREKIQTLVDIARMANGVRQAPVWRMVADTLDQYTTEVKPQDS